MRSPAAAHSVARIANVVLFNAAPEDILQFGHGQGFDAKKAAQFLSLKKSDIGRISAVSETSVRYDNHIPEQVRVSLEETAATINLVAKQFDGDATKTASWFKARNPLLGDVSPRDMIRLGRLERLRLFIIQAMTDDSDALVKKR